MGRTMIGFHDPVCNSFESKIRNDQLCYEVDLEKFKDEKRIKEQLKSGLVLILDYNLERQSEMYNPKKDSNQKNNDVEIHLDTISMLSVFTASLKKDFNDCFFRSSDLIRTRRI